MAQHQGDLGGDAGHRRHAVALGELERVPRPPAGHEHGRAAAVQVAGQLGGGTEVGQRRRRQRGAARCVGPHVAGVDGGDGVDLALPEHRALRGAGGARGEHDGDRAVGVGGQGGQVGGAALVGQVGQQVGHAGGGDDLDQVGVTQVARDGGVGPEVSGGQHQPRCRPLEDGGPLGDGQPGVDPSGDGAEAGGGDVGHDVVGDGGQDQRHHVALAHAAGPQAGGHGPGPIGQLAVGQRPPVGREVGGSIAEPLGGGVDHLAEHHRSHHDGRQRGWSLPKRGPAVDPQDETATAPSRGDGRASAPRPSCSTPACRCWPSAASTRRASTTSCGRPRCPTAPSTCTSPTRKTCSGPWRCAAPTR